MSLQYAPGMSPVPAGSSLNPIQYIRNEKIMRLSEQSVFDRITVFKGFGRCGTPMNIRHQYQVRDRVQQVQNGGVLKPQQVLVPREQTFMVGDKFGTSLAWDDCTWNKIMSNDPELVSEVIDAYQEDTMLTFDMHAFAKIIGEASSDNRGSKAGAKYHNLNLGTQANPLVTNEKTIWAQHRAISNVLRQQNIRGSQSNRKVYAIVAEGFLDYMALNDRMSSYYHNGNCMQCDTSSMVEMRTVDNVEYIVSKTLPVIMDNGSIVMPIIFGYDDALWSSYDFAMYRKEGGHGDDNKYIDLYWHLGLKLIEPRKVGVMWVRVDPIPTGV